MKIYEQSGPILDSLVCLALGHTLVDGKSPIAYTDKWAGLGTLLDAHYSCVPTFDERFCSWFAYSQSPVKFGKQNFVTSFFRALVAQKFGNEFDSPL